MYHLAGRPRVMSAFKETTVTEREQLFNAIDRLDNLATLALANLENIELKNMLVRRLNSIRHSMPFREVIETTAVEKPIRYLSTDVSEVVELESSRLVPGCCVVLNDAELPCARLIAVVQSVHGRNIIAKYLNDSGDLRPYRRGCRTTIEAATPVGRFGIKVLMSGDEYCCEVIGESTATYPDGRPRRWQDSQGVVWRPINKGAIGHLDIDAIHNGAN